MIRYIKLFLGAILLIIGLVYEIIVYRQLQDASSSEISSTTASDEIVYPGADYEFIIPENFPTVSAKQIPKHNYHHILYGLGMISGAILLASIRDDKS